MWQRVSEWMDGRTNEWMTPFLNIELNGGSVDYDCQVCYWVRPANRTNLPDYTVS